MNTNLPELTQVLDEIELFERDRTSLRNDIKRSFRESVQNLLSWALNSPARSIDELMHQIEGMFV